MYGGIDKLVDTYKGNPQPLAANLQQAQKQQPPGSIPADLEEALALQKIAELRNAFAGQQAMQTGGAQPTVMDKLKQIVGGMQQQAQPPQMPQQMMQRPVMAASGGSIDQLMSNLGQHYAHGGIVAFTNGGRGEDKLPKEDEDKLSPEAAREIAMRMKQRTNMMPDSMKVTDLDVTSFPELQKSDLYAKAMAAAQGEKPIPSNEDIKKALAFVSAPAAAGLDVLLSPLKFLANNSFRSPLSKEPLANYTTAMDARNSYLYGDKAKEAQAVAPTAAVDVDPETQKLINLAGSRAQTGQNTNPALQPSQAVAPAAPSSNRTNVGAGNAPAQSTTEKVDPTSLRGITEAYLRGELGIKPEDERRKAVDWTKQTLGLDALLAEKQGRIDSRAAAIEAAKAARTPEWVKGLQALSGAPIRGGAGMVLGQMGAGATRAREAYAEQDMKYADELDRLRDVITDAKISGNKELVKEGMAAYKEVDARRRAAATSATSLLNTDENVKARMQASRDAAAGRAQSAAIQAENAKANRLQRQQQFLAQEERKWQDTLSRNPEYKKLVDARSMQERLLYTSTDPKTQEKAQEAVDLYNEKIAKMMPTSQAGTVNIPPPPPNAVREIKKT